MRARCLIGSPAKLQSCEHVEEHGLLTVWQASRRSCYCRYRPVHDAPHDRHAFVGVPRGESAINSTDLVLRLMSRLSAAVCR